MKTFLTITMLILFITNHVYAQNKNESLKTVITAKEELDDYIGQYVTIKGEVSNTKIPQILGVDVNSENPDLRGEFAVATGILVKWIVSEDEVDSTVTNRGAGTFYRLTEKKSDFDVQVQKPY